MQPRVHAAVEQVEKMLCPKMAKSEMEEHVVVDQGEGV